MAIIQPPRHITTSLMRGQARLQNVLSPCVAVVIFAVSFLVIASSTSAVQTTASTNGRWTIHPLDSVLQCVPVTFGSSTDSPANSLLRVWMAYTPQIENLVLNAVESLLTSFPHDLVERGERRRRGGGGGGDAPRDNSNKSTCAAWMKIHSLSPTSIEFHTIDFPWSGLCFGLQDVSSSATSSSSSVDKSSKGHTAAFGTAKYYALLEQKLTFFSLRVDEASSEKINRRSTMEEDTSHTRTVTASPWMLFLDADVQVFPGFYHVLAAKALCPYTELHCSIAHYVGGGGCPSTRTAANERVHVFFQRETRKLVNTGVIFADSSAPGVGCMFHEARRILTHSKYGDQTAIQKLLKKQRGFCTKHPLSSPSSPTEGDTATSPVPLTHSVFHRTHVNGNVLNASLLVVHHAHMSGHRKQEGLLAALKEMQAACHSPRRMSCYGGGGGGMSSGVFLQSNPTSTLCSKPTAHDALTPTTAACSVLSASRVHDAAMVPLQQQRRLFQISESGSGSTSQPSIARLLGNSSLEFVAGNVVVNATGGRKRKKIKSKAIWAALPALLVIITLTVYHYYVSGPQDMYHAVPGEAAAVEMSEIRHDSQP